LTGGGGDCWDGSYCIGVLDFRMLYLHYAGVLRADQFLLLSIRPSKYP